MLRPLVTFALLPFLLPSSFAAEAPGAVGSVVRPFAVRQLEGGTVELPTHHKDAKALVVVFLSFDCPVAKSYLAPLGEIARAYADKGVVVVGVVADEGPASVKKQAAKFDVAFPLYADPELKAIRELGAKNVPEAFVLDAKGALCYRGRVDDRWISPGKSNPRIPVPDLRNALDEVLAGKPVTLSQTQAVGCPAPRGERRAAPGGVASKYTYHRDVLPILQARCQECHRPGEVGPFSLLTYKDALRWADLMVEYVATHQMPPWKPTAGPGYRNERTMPQREIDILTAWAEAGCPEGDAKDVPATKSFDGTDGWTLGKPDLVLEMTDDFHLAPSGPDHFRVMVLPTGLTEDKMITAYEVKPGNPRIVHHTINYFDTTGKARQLEQAEAKRPKEPGEPDRGPGYTSAMGIGFLSFPGTTGGLGGWTPGQRGFTLPAGTGYYLPKGADVVIQMHYHRNGRVEKDRTKIGLYFGKNPDSLKRLKLVVVPGLVAKGETLEPFRTIPAGNANYLVRGRSIVQEDCTIYSILPHMHMLGKSVRVTMTPPGGKPITLVNIEEWDYNWQESYFFQEPIEVKAGTQFDITAVFDNSAANPNNPFAPPRLVKKGEQTTDEMLFGFIRATSSGPGFMVKTQYVTEAGDY